MLAASGFAPSPPAPSAFTATITTNQQELNLATWATGEGWDGTSEAIIGVDIGVYIWSDNTAIPALTTGTFPGGLTIINNGFIIGKGGQGGGTEVTVVSPLTTGQVLAEAGGPAISLDTDAFIDSALGYIGGGGGGGGIPGFFCNGGTGGGGAGGGRGGPSTWSADGPGAGTTAELQSSTQPGGAGGGLGGSGGNGVVFDPPTTFGQPNAYSTAGGGGRVIPGSGAGGSGTVSRNGDARSGARRGLGGTAGGGGAAYVANGTFAVESGGGGGGGWGASGGTTRAASISFKSTNFIRSATGGGGGTTGNGSNGSRSSDGTPTDNPGAAGGSAVILNGNVVTWVGGFPSTRVFGAVA